MLVGLACFKYILNIDFPTYSQSTDLLRPLGEMPTSLRYTLLSLAPIVRTTPPSPPPPLRGLSLSLGPPSHNPSGARLSNIYFDPVDLSELGNKARRFQQRQHSLRPTLDDQTRQHVTRVHPSQCWIQGHL